MLLETLIIAAEKAANIARKCRENEHLFQLLIEEKSDTKANPRFVKDFKTLADVLIQETLKHDIGIKCPELKDHINGEESNIFCNVLGETICVQVLDTPQETAELLEKVLNGDTEAAQLLAEEVHHDLELKDVTVQPPEEIELDLSELGIWIDPIDSTAEYINGSDKNEVLEGIFSCGLRCVTVLIGVYNLTTGNAVMGIVNQPFYGNINGRWHGVCYWGYDNGISKACSLASNSFCETRIVCLSSSEDENIKERLKSAGFQLVETAGAGYKMLATIIGIADAYVLTKNSTFKWDSCGPHAILRSMHGDIISFKEASESNRISSLKYNVGDKCQSKIETCCNNGGLLAYRNSKVMAEIVNALKVVCDSI